MDERQLTGLLDGLYDGILSAEGWRATLGELAAATASESASLVLWDRRTDQALVGDQVGLPDALVADYARHFHLLDPGRGRIDAVATGEWYLDERDFGSPAMRSSPFYQDFLRHYGLDSTMASPFMRGEGLDGFLSLGSGAGRRDLVQVSRSLAPLMPHFRRAAALRLRLVDLARQADIQARMLDRFTFPVAAVTASRRVLVANARAQAWLSGPGCPLAASSPHAAEVVRMLRIACGAGQPRRSAGLRLARPDGLAMSLTAVPLPAGGTAPWLVSEPAALLLVNEPGPAQPRLGHVLRDLFRLTPAEVRLLERLLAGKALKVACGELDIGYETGRTQLQAIFGKFGVRRQSEIVRILARLDVFDDPGPG